MNSTAADCGAVALMFRRTNFPPDLFSAGRNGDYIWRDLWTGPSVCNRSVTGSLPFGFSHRLGRCCLWLAGLPFRLIGSAEVPLRHHLFLPVSRSEPHEVGAPFTLLCVVTRLAGRYLLSEASMIWSYPWTLHCVGTLYGQMAEVYLLNWTCLCMIRASVCVVSFLPLIQQFTEPCQLPPEYADYQNHNSPPMPSVPFLEDRTMAVHTFSYCVYEFLRDQELGTGRSPNADKADSFHGHIRWAKLNVFAPDSRDVRELWVVRPHMILVKVIYVCGFHVFFHQYVADIRERKSENIFRTASTSPLVFNMTVMSSSGVGCSC